MPAPLLNKTNNFDETTQGILATLAFFSLYEIPLSARRIFELLYEVKTTEAEVKLRLDSLVGQKKIFLSANGYSFKPLDSEKYRINQEELKKRWLIVDRYFMVLSAIPFVEHISVINSLAVGNVHQESDIDFFVITKPNRLYFVRSIIIVMFKILGIYKTKSQTKDRFCFGFFVSSDHPELADVLIKGGDPLFAFWFASFAPIFGRHKYENLVETNSWILRYFPNFQAQNRTHYLRSQQKSSKFIKIILEVLLFIPAAISEPLLRFVHIRHTFKLPENHWPTATTVANKHMLKLHALDPRKDVRGKFFSLLQNLY